MAILPRPSAPGRSTALADVPAPRQAQGSGRPAATHDPAPPEPAALAGLAWIVREITHVPGILRLRRGRLSFESTRGVLFDATAAELGLEIGRSIRAGMHVTVGTERLRVCVVRPSGGVDPCRDLVDRAVDRATDPYDPYGDGEAATSVTAGGSDAWTAWRPLLAPEPPAVARPRTRVRRAFTFAPS